MSTVTTAQAIADITDEGFFEQLCAAVLREAEVGPGLLCVLPSVAATLKGRSEQRSHR